MLVRLQVENFLSFDNKSVLDMVTSNKIKRKPEHKIKMMNTSLLKHAVVYGANASGKSNLIEVFSFIQYCVRKSIPANAYDMFCKTKKSNQDRPSTFELFFTDGDKFYAYGFSVILRERKITAEWLHQLNQNGTAKTLFERSGGEKPRFEQKDLDDADAAKVLTYLDDFDEQSSSLFLSFMNKGKKYASSSQLAYFQHVFNWINCNINVFSPDSPVTHYEYYYQEASLSLINQFIRIFDTGITDIIIKEITLEEMARVLPRPVYDDIMDMVKRKMEKEDSKTIKFSMRCEDSFFNISCSAEVGFKITTISLKHGDAPFDFIFKEESDGTRKLFKLLDILLNEEEYKVYVIDEIERSLHP